MSNGIPMPSAAKTMWKARDMAICERAKNKSVIDAPNTGVAVGGIGRVEFIACTDILQLALQCLVEETQGEVSLHAKKVIHSDLFQPGALRGRLHVGPEFFEPLADKELARWE